MIKKKHLTLVWSKPRRHKPTFTQMVGVAIVGILTLNGVGSALVLILHDKLLLAYLVIPATLVGYKLILVLFD